MVTVVVAVLAQSAPYLSVTVNVYVPENRVLAFVMAGLAKVDVNPLGPTQE
jgi:hypothetical protein